MISKSNLSVLVVEDNPGDYDLVVEYLSAVGNTNYQFQHCTSVQEVSAILKDSRVDVILLDLSLPDSSGIDTVSNMRGINVDLPIIVLTGTDNDELGEQAIQQGAQEYLNKNEVSGRMLARIIRYAIKRKKMDKKLETLALTDPLTGLYNRRYFFERGWNEYVRARRYHHPLAIIMVDLDFFKQINDKHGHACGDKVLMEVAKLFLQTLRDVDLVARFGGEEFIILIPETDQAGVEFLAQRIRQEIYDTPMEHNGKNFNITASLGVALIEGVVGDFESLINQADIALYHAKENGRNKVELYDVNLASKLASK
jgi:diguanylate cyclase (GGDEF) domain